MGFVPITSAIPHTFTVIINFCMHARVMEGLLCLLVIIVIKRYCLMKCLYVILLWFMKF